MSIRPATTAHGSVQQEGDIGGDGGDPHKDEHLDADIGFDVQLVLSCQGDLGSEADDGGNDSRETDDDGRNGAEERQPQTPPSSADDKRAHEHEDGVDADAGHEAAVHDLGADSEDGENGDGLGRQGDLGAGEKFANEHLDGVEPVELLRVRAMGNASGSKRQSAG